MHHKTHKEKILIVDDDEGVRDSLEQILEDEYEVQSVPDGRRALDVIHKKSCDLVLLDLVMPDMGGLEALESIKSFDASIDVIMISATDRAKEAISAIRAGAYDYLAKPFDPDTILALVERVLQKRRMEKELSYLRSEVAQQTNHQNIVSQSPEMSQVLSLVEKVAGASSSILITGESGTGKELIARAIHNKSGRCARPFVAINCASIPSELIESELFGHEKGSFTGADKRTVGKFEFANEGTLFLDEVASLKLELQAQLLRVLQEKEIMRVGSNRTIAVDVRVIAATNTRLETLVQKGKFREDLYFRLNVIPVTLPPLRHRKGDVLLLANYFLEKFNRQMSKHLLGIAPDAMAVLERYPWPGNIRELENFIERMVVLGTDGRYIEEKDLPLDLLFHEHSSMFSEQSTTEEKSLTKARQAFERQYILRVLRSSRWNQAEAARKLKIHRNTLINKVKLLKINQDSLN